jgi:hypothetical protein
MFYAFLLRGLSPLSHEFLCGFLFIYGVQLHQLTLNSILHIACFITLCETFLGIDPHWVLWKNLFRLHRNASKNEVHDLGGAIISVRSESQYLKFEMADSVQTWRENWFYIKDKKSSESDKYGLAPFDAAKGLTKLKSWNSLPSDDEVEAIQLLLAQILELKNAAQKGLNGTQFIVFFLQHRIQPLQARVSKLWSYSGVVDPSRVSKKDPAPKDLEKRVRSMTKLTSKNDVLVCLATPFDAIHPLPKVPDFFDLHKYSALLFFLMFHFTKSSFFTYYLSL